MSSRLVVKIGGEMARSRHLAPLARDLVDLAVAGYHVIVVHGGGPQVSELQLRLGQEPTLIAGRRVTDAAALEALKMSVAGALNIDISAAILAAGGSPIGLNGVSSLLIHARKRPPVLVAGGGDTPIDFGRVGDVIDVNRKLLELLVTSGYIPVIACLGADEWGVVYNINADVVASQIARAVGASALVLVTDVAAVRADAGDPTSRLARLTRAEALQAIASGQIRGGMIPKLTEGFGALDNGVGAVLIIGQLAAGDLVRAITEPGSVGTLLTSAAPS